jgi:hypothetical protein
VFLGVPPSPAGGLVEWSGVAEGLAVPQAWRSFTLFNLRLLRGGHREEPRSSESAARVS